MPKHDQMPPISYNKIPEFWQQRFVRLSLRPLLPKLLDLWLTGLTQLKLCYPDAYKLDHTSLEAMVKWNAYDVFR